MSDEQQISQARGLFTKWPSPKAILRNTGLTLLVIFAVSIFLIAAVMAYRWTWASYYSGTNEADIVQIAELVIAVSSVVLAGSFLVTIAIPFVAVREIKESLSDLSRNADTMLKEKVAKIESLQVELDRLETLSANFLSPAEIYEEVDKRVEASDKVIRDMIREKFKPAWDLEKQILTVVERDVYQTLIAGGLIKKEPRNPPKPPRKAA